MLFQSNTVTTLSNKSHSFSQRCGGQNSSIIRSMRRCKSLRKRWEKYGAVDMIRGTQDIVAIDPRLQGNRIKMKICAIMVLKRLKEVYSYLRMVVLDIF